MNLWGRSSFWYSAHVRAILLVAMRLCSRIFVPREIPWLRFTNTSPWRSGIFLPTRSRNCPKEILLKKSAKCLDKICKRRRITTKMAAFHEVRLRVLYCKLPCEGLSIKIISNAAKSLWSRKRTTQRPCSLWLRKLSMLPHGLWWPLYWKPFWFCLNRT